MYYGIILGFLAFVTIIPMHDAGIPAAPLSCSSDSGCSNPTPRCCLDGGADDKTCVTMDKCVPPTLPATCTANAECNIAGSTKPTCCIPTRGSKGVCTATDMCCATSGTCSDNVATTCCKSTGICQKPELAGAGCGASTTSCGADSDCTTATSGLTTCCKLTATATSGVCTAPGSCCGSGTGVSAGACTDTVATTCCKSTGICQTPDLAGSGCGASTTSCTADATCTVTPGLNTCCRQTAAATSGVCTAAGSCCGSGTGVNTCTDPVATACCKPTGVCQTPELAGEGCGASTISCADDSYCTITPGLNTCCKIKGAQSSSTGVCTAVDLCCGSGNGVTSDECSNAAAPACCAKTGVCLTSAPAATCAQSTHKCGYPCGNKKYCCALSLTAFIELFFREYCFALALFCIED